MSTKKQLALALAVLLLVVTLPGVSTKAHVLAQAGEGYTLSWSTVDGGGGAIEGNEYSLTGTVGQPDAGDPLTGGDYTLIGGFQGNGHPEVTGYSVYLPMILR